MIIHLDSNYILCSVSFAKDLTFYLFYYYFKYSKSTSHYITPYKHNDEEKGVGSWLCRRLLCDPEQVALPCVTFLSEEDTCLRGHRATVYTGGDKVQKPLGLRR